MQDFFGFMWLGSIIVFIVGLIKPDIVIRWGEKRTRKKVMLFS